MGGSRCGTDPGNGIIAAYKMQQRRYRRRRRVVFYRICCIPGVLEYDGIAILWTDVLQRVLYGDGGLGVCIGSQCKKNEAAISAIFTAGMGLYYAAVEDRAG